MTSTIFVVDRKCGIWVVPSTTKLRRHFYRSCRSTTQRPQQQWSWSRTRWIWPRSFCLTRSFAQCRLFSVFSANRLYMTVLKCELSVVEALLSSKMPLFSGFPAMLLEELQMRLLMMRLHVACLVLEHLFARPLHRCVMRFFVHALQKDVSEDLLYFFAKRLSNITSWSLGDI